jgi:hypothetical protein
MAFKQLPHRMIHKARIELLSNNIVYFITKSNTQHFKNGTCEACFGT